jgi:N-acetylglucosamine-6-phosphate deacetylase
MDTLYARRLITPDGIIEFPVVSLTPDGRIASIDSCPDEPQSATSSDTLAPTLVDIHFHGAKSHDVMTAGDSGYREINRFLGARGVGHYLATTVTAPVDQTLRSLELIAHQVEAAAGGQRQAAATPIGIHLEGPFISHPRRGVHPDAEILPPSIALFDRFQQAARGHIRLITLAPEIPGALDLIRHAVASGVRVSIGHTDANAAETRAGIAAGANSATHIFNGMRPLDHRAPGVIGTILDSDRLFAELICDGIHVAPEIVRLWLKLKGPDLAILVTDAISAAGMPDGTYLLGTLEVSVAHGRALLQSALDQGTETFAGSILTLDKAVENLQAFTGATLATAVRLASANPLRMLGLLQPVAPGAPANLNRCDGAGHLCQTILQGQIAG